MAADEVTAVTLEDLKKLKVPELKVELKKRGLPTKGLKAELVTRLYKCLESGFQLPAIPEREKESSTEWKNCEAKRILYAELLAGIISLDKEDMNARDVYDNYKDEPAFKNVPFKNFGERLKRLRIKVLDKNDRSKRDAEALAHDRQIYPQVTEKPGGEPVWAGSKAQGLLEKDVDDKKHIKMSKEKLYLSKDEYQLFDLRCFRGHVYQELKKRKFLAYCKTTKRGKNYGAERLLVNERRALESSKQTNSIGY